MHAITPEQIITNLSSWGQAVTSLLQQHQKEALLNRDDVNINLVFKLLKENFFSELHNLRNAKISHSSPSNGKLLRSVGEALNHVPFAGPALNAISQVGALAIDNHHLSKHKGVAIALKVSLPTDLAAFAELIALLVTHSLANNIETLSNEACNRLSEKLVEIAVEQIKKHQLYYYISDNSEHENYKAFHIIAFQLYHYIFYPQLSRFKYDKFTTPLKLDDNHSLVTSNDFITVQGLLSRSAVAVKTDDGSSVYHLQKPHDKRNAITKTGKYVIPRQAVWPGEADLLALIDVIHPKSPEVSTTTVLGRTRRAIQSISNSRSSSTSSMRSLSSIDVETEEEREIRDDLITTYQEQYQKFNTQLGQFRCRSNKVRLLKESLHLDLPKNWETLCKWNQHIDTLSLEDIHDASLKMINEAIVNINNCYKTLKTDFIELTSILLSLSAVDYIKLPEKYEKILSTSTAELSDEDEQVVATMVKSYVAEHYHQNHQNSDLVNAITAEHLNHIIHQNKKAEKRHQQSLHISNPDIAIHNSTVGKRLHWRDRHNNAKKAISFKDNTHYLQSLATPNKITRILAEREQLTSTRLSSHDVAQTIISQSNQRINTSIQLYAVLTGDFIGPIALSNHSSFKALLGRTLRSIIKYIRKCFNKPLEEALTLDLHKNADREKYINRYITGNNRSYVEKYWDRALANQIRKHPKNSRNAVIIGLEQKNSTVINHFDELVANFPLVVTAELYNLKQVSEHNMQHTA